MIQRLVITQRINGFELFVTIIAVVPHINISVNVTDMNFQTGFLFESFPTNITLIGRLAAGKEWIVI